MPVYGFPLLEPGEASAKGFRWRLDSTERDEVTVVVDTAIGELIPVIGVRPACNAVGAAQADC